MKILALTKYGDAAASTRQRFLAFRPALEAAGHQLVVSPLFGNYHVGRIAGGKRAELRSVMAAYFRRVLTITSQTNQFDALWIHCELFPYLPAFFEGLAFTCRLPVVFDYDDAIFHMYDDRLFLGGKLKPLIRGAAAVIAGNSYLAKYARQWNANVEVIPTVVDTGVYIPAVSRQSDVPVIGWIGSPSTWPYVRSVLPVLADLCCQGDARMLAVGAGPAAELDSFHGMELRDWEENREIEDVQAMDIGIMPLPDEPWARGKCGYKLIQYMACGLPTVASPVGVNEQIVEAGMSGYLATSPGDWRRALEELLADAGKRQRFGTHGRERVVRDYSLESQSLRMVKLFSEIAGL